VLSKKPDGVLDPEKQYAVVLLNENQVQQLMGGRPAARPINRGYTVRDVHSRFLRLKRQTTAIAITVLVVGVGAFVWFMVPQPAVASIFAWKETGDTPVLATGPSFSVTVASLDSSDAAGSAATRVRSLGLPVFTRLSPDRNQLHQAMVGPFASLDEAVAQRHERGAYLRRRVAAQRAAERSAAGHSRQQSQRAADRGPGARHPRH
jgi:hypothetical protein